MGQMAEKIAVCEEIPSGSSAFVATQRFEIRGLDAGSGNPLKREGGRRDFALRAVDGEAMETGRVVDVNSYWCQAGIAPSLAFGVNVREHQGVPAFSGER